MKKLILGTVVLGLCGLAAVYITSCAKQSGPFSPSFNALGAGNSNYSGLPTASFTPPGGTLPLSGTAQVAFSLPMNSATLVGGAGGTVLMYSLAGTGVTETFYANYNLSYNPQTKTLSIRPSNGSWAANTSYRVELTTGCQSANGRQLDGNANRIPESSTFDNYHATFDLGAPATSYVGGMRCVQYAASWISNSGGTGLSFGGYNGGVSGSYSYVTLTVNFNLNGIPPGDFTMAYKDVNNGFFVDANTLHKNIIFTTAAGVSVVPVPGTVTVTANGGYLFSTWSAAFVLAPGTQYKFKLLGGVNGIRSSSAAGLILRNGFYLDGNNNNVAEANDDTPWVTLETAGAANAALPRVWVNPAATWDAGNRRFVVPFTVPYGTSGLLDPASVNDQTFQLFNTTFGVPYQNVIPSAIELDNSVINAPVVYVYVPMKFGNNTGTGTYNIQLVVSPNVRSSDGVYLDQNGTGVPGSPDDGYSLAPQAITNFP